MAWCCKCKLHIGPPRKNTRKTNLELLLKLKFDDSDQFLGSDRVELNCIFALTTGDNIGKYNFFLQVDYG